MATALFTFVMEYKGGTYISQARASTLVKAIRAWAKSIDRKRINAPRSVTESALVALAEDGDPVPVKTVRSVWCLGFRLGRSYAMVHVVRTSCEGSSNCGGRRGPKRVET